MKTKFQITIHKLGKSIRAKNRGFIQSLIPILTLFLCFIPEAYGWSAKELYEKIQNDGMVHILTAVFICVGMGFAFLLRIGAFKKESYSNRDLSGYNDSARDKMLGGMGMASEQNTGTTVMTIICFVLIGAAFVAYPYLMNTNPEAPKSDKIEETKSKAPSQPFGIQTKTEEWVGHNFETDFEFFNGCITSIEARTSEEINRKEVQDSLVSAITKGNIVDLSAVKKKPKAQMLNKPTSKEDQKEPLKFKITEISPSYKEPKITVVRMEILNKKEKGKLFWISDTKIRQYCRQMD